MGAIEEGRCCGGTIGQWHYLLIYLADPSTSFIHWAAANQLDHHPSLKMILILLLSSTSLYNCQMLRCKGRSQMWQRHFNTTTGLNVDGTRYFA